MIHTTTDSSQAPNLSNDVPIEKSGETLVQDNFVYSEQFEKLMKEAEELIQHIKQSYDDRKVDNAFKKVEICEALINNLDNEEEKKKFKELLDKESVIFTDIKEEYKYMKVIITELDKDEGWNVEKDNEDYRILYRKIPNTKLYSIRMEAEADIPLINLITLINEVDLWHLWVAFVNKTIEIKSLNKGAKVYFAEFGLPYPLSKRMMHVYGAGINRLDENGTVLAVAKSMDHDKDFFIRHNTKKVETKGDVNIDLNLGGFQITPINEHKIKFKVVANVDPNLSWCPDSLINLITRKVAKFILSRMVSYAKKFEGSEWEKETKKPEKKEFYDWLNNQVNQYFEKIKAQKAAESAQETNVESREN